MFVGEFALSGLLGSRRASMFPLGTLPLGLWIIAVDPAFIAWHFFSSLKQNFIAYRSSNVPSRSDCILEIHQLWQSRFSRVYPNWCCSCTFEAEIIKIGQTFHKMCSNYILNFQESTTILNARTKSLETYWRHHVVLLLHNWYFSLLRSFYTSVSWWFFAGGWVTESFLKSPGLLVFWPISTML